MALLPALPALLVAPSVAALIYADASRRGRSQRHRLAWSVGTALVSLCGFLGASAFNGVIARASTPASSDAVVVVSPVQLLLGQMFVGLGISVLAVVAYGVGSRYGPLSRS